MLLGCTGGLAPGRVLWCRLQALWGETVEQTKQEILKQIDAALEFWSTHRAKAEYDDLSDLGPSLYAEVDTILATTLDRLAPATSPYREWMSHTMANKAGALRALRRDYDAGYLSKFQSLVRAEVFADFLEMAEHLLEQGYKDPCAVLVGGCPGRSPPKPLPEPGYPVADVGQAQEG